MMVELSSKEQLNEFLDNFDIDENDPDILVKIAKKANLDLRNKNSLGKAKLFLYQKFLNEGKNKIANRWLKDSADDDYAPACTLYGKQIYLSGKNKDLAFEKADNYLKKARDLKFPFAFYVSAQIRFDKADMRWDMLDMLNQGANLDCKHCCRELGYECMKKEDDPELLKQAFALLSKAVYLGDHASAFNIGRILELGNEGMEIKQDLNGALKYYKFAIDGDLKDEQTISAMHNLAAMAFNLDIDTGLKLDDAINLYKQAAELGSYLSYESLGRIYLFGEGVKGEHVEKNIPEAIKWLTKASQHDSPQAKKWLEEINKFYN